MYCCRSRFASAGGGVRARFRGEAWNDWNCEPNAKALGGTEVREAACGDWYGEAGIYTRVSMMCAVCMERRLVHSTLTGVRSRDPSSSVALVAASIRSSHRLPYSAAGVGSLENALRSPLFRLALSLLRFRSCLAMRACCVKLLVRGRACCRE